MHFKHELIFLNNERRKDNEKMITFLLAVTMVFGMVVNASASNENAAQYAYLDYEATSTVMKEKIMEARLEIIYSTDWVADGYTGYIQNVETGEVIRELPSFSEVFPSDWEIPVQDVTTYNNKKSYSASLSGGESYDTNLLRAGWSRYRVFNANLKAPTAQNTLPFAVFDVDPIQMGNSVKAYATSLT